MDGEARVSVTVGAYVGHALRIAYMGSSKIRVVTAGWG